MAILLLDTTAWTDHATLDHGKSSYNQAD